MSNFQALAIHPETKEAVMAYWVDDYFGRHKYGVQFPDGKVFPEDQIPEDPKNDD